MSELRGHQWTGMRQGGNPADAESYEWIRFCKICGIEDSCEEDLPPCVNDGDGRTSQKMTPVYLARLFHDWYEALAPEFGYETREDTRAFDPESKNGKLMIATCEKVLTHYILEPKISEE